MRCKLKRGPKGQANLGGSGCMVPWKILKFEVVKEVISCTLGAKLFVTGRHGDADGNYSVFVTDNRIEIRNRLIVG